MQITFLGTGTSQGVPVIGCRCAVCQSKDPKDNRLRSAIAIKQEGHTFIIDVGPDFRQQLLRASITNVDAILLTHEHKDHTAGLDDVRALNWVNKKPIDLYGEQRVLHTIRAEYSYAFVEKRYPGVPDINLFEINCEPFSIGNSNIVPIRVMHHQLNVLGYRFGKFAYITDANYISDLELEKLKGVEVFVLNGLRYEHHMSHYSITEAVEIIQKVNPKRGIITHCSHQLGLYCDVNVKLPNGIELGYDGMTLEV